MRFEAIFLLFSVFAPSFGQAQGNPPASSRQANSASERRPANVPDDIMNFLVQSQIVDFKPNLSRDPFVVPSNDPVRSVEGFLIEDIIIQGKVVVRNKPFAIILDNRQNVRTIPVGYEFLDGKLTAITDNALIFDQWDVNTTNRSIQRTITKVFKREEEK